MSSQIQTAKPRTTLSDWLALVALAVVFAAALLPLAAPRGGALDTFALVFSSIILEAMPFMLLGALVGGLIEVFVSRERMDALLPRSNAAAACVAAGLGVLFPVCECAIVPVVRRLARKGLPAAAVVAYLLAGPIVNPVVALSTAMAYNFDWRPVVVRLGFGYGIAVTVALVVAAVFRRGTPFISVVAADNAPCACGCGHAHHHHDEKSLSARVVDAFNHALDDFMATAPYLVAGAALAALAQTGVERRAFAAASSSPLAASGLMMLLAVLLNLCSEADAFIAASFRGLTPFSAQMAFLVIGPMVDIKLLLMYRTLFKPGTTALLAGGALALTAAMAAAIELAGGGL